MIGLPQLYPFLIQGPGFPQGKLIHAHFYEAGEAGITFYVHFQNPETGEVLAAPRYYLTADGQTLIEMINPLFPGSEAGH